MYIICTDTLIPYNQGGTNVAPRFRYGHQGLRTSRGIKTKLVQVTQQFQRESSTGFKHVFVGQTRGNSMTGFHNWLFYYTEELQGRMEINQ